MKKLTITAALLTSLFASVRFASQYDKPRLATQVGDVRIGGFREKTGVTERLRGAHQAIRGIGTA